MEQKDLGDTATRKPGGCSQTLINLLFRLLKPTSHAIYFDTDFNSEKSVLGNMFISFLICAMKFHTNLKSEDLSVDRLPLFS